jgi:hypothetical protein
MYVVDVMRVCVWMMVCAPQVIREQPHFKETLPVRWLQCLDLILHTHNEPLMHMDTFMEKVSTGLFVL